MRGESSENCAAGKWAAEPAFLLLFLNMKNEKASVPPFSQTITNEMLSVFRLH